MHFMRNFSSLVVIICLFSAFSAKAQFDPLNPPNTFRSKDNPYYWQNRPPHPGYWQQDVHYQIKANIDEKTDIIEASEQLTYWNNSPDDLEFVFFHLYQNAFQPGSYYDKLHEANEIEPDFGRYESQGLGTEISSIMVDGQEVKTELDNTILKVWLPKPLKSGGSVKFDIEFKTYFDTGSIRRRMKMFYPTNEHKHYDGVHWYPRISVYDRKFGWTTDQHLGREFYGDFGTFDVELTFASNFIVEATGNMINRDEMLPPDLRQKLDINNFADKEWNSWPSEIIPYNPDERKTWKFHAENVHDFAFTADPTYRIGEAEWNGIKCYSLVQEPHASGWLNAADYAAKVIEVYSKDFGMYAYHKMIVADARDGMEYPMLTLDGGKDPTYKGLLSHEIAHNWFFGMIGTNETYRASMDEGFTQFLTSWSMQNINGPNMPRSGDEPEYVQRYTDDVLVRDARVYYGYLQDAVKGEDARLNVHSDDYGAALRHGGGYRHVYYKTATMLYNLQYVLGDSLFQDAMQHYFNQWKMCHPYFEDFRNSFIQYTGVDLNWFFDQWWTTTKSIDYKIKDVSKVRGSEDEYVITFERKGDMQMPIDFRVISRTGNEEDFYIPNTWFAKKTSATTLPRWIGWSRLNPVYEARVTISGGIEEVIIDPSNRLADVYMLDNKTIFPVTYNLDAHIDRIPDWKNYEVFTRPDVWYNGYDGIKTGLHLNGNYMNYKHKFDFTMWFHTGFLQHGLDSTLGVTSNDNISFRFTFREPIEKIWDNTFLNFQAKVLDGLYAGQFGIDKRNDRGNNTFYFYYKSMLRPDNTDLNYLIYPGEWIVDRFNNTFNSGFRHTYEYKKGSGDINLGMKTAGFGGDYDYSQIWLNVVNKNDLGKIKLNTRMFALFGTGENTPNESSLFLAGANPEEMMENKFTRARGWIPSEWHGYGITTNNFQHGGGLNLRGYAGYLAPQENADGTLDFIYRGTSGGSVNMELEFDEIFGLRFPQVIEKTIDLDLYLFGDAGVMNVEPGKEYEPSDIRADAGLGTAFTIKRFGPLVDVKPLTIRFDMPLFLNRTPAVDTDFVQFRYIVGVERAF